MTSLAALALAFFLGVVVAVKVVAWCVVWLAKEFMKLVGSWFDRAM